MLRLAGKNALITGASTGIGQAIAVRFAQEGANVAINFRNDPDQASVTEQLVHQACAAIRGCGTRDMLVQADISQEADVQRMFAEVIREFGSIDILVNNAGIQKPAASHDVELADFDRVSA